MENVLLAGQYIYIIYCGYNELPQFLR